MHDDRPILFRAYVVMTFRAPPSDTLQIPKYTGAGIYSESARSLTGYDKSVFYTDVLYADGETYVEARLAAIESCRLMPALRWLASYLESQ
jgi:hypothetical protein